MIELTEEKPTLELLLDTPPTSSESDGFAPNQMRILIENHIKNHRFDEAKNLISAQITEYEKHLKISREEIIDQVPKYYNWYTYESPVHYVRKAKNERQFLKRVQKANKRLRSELGMDVTADAIERKTEEYLFLKEMQKEDLTWLMAAQKEIKKAQIKAEIKRFTSRYKPKINIPDFNFDSKDFTLKYGTAIGAAVMTAGLGWLAYELYQSGHAVTPEIISSQTSAVATDITDKLELAQKQFDTATTQLTAYQESLKHYVVQKGDSLTKIVKTLGEKASHPFSLDQIQTYTDAVAEKAGKMSQKKFEAFTKAVSYTKEQIMTSPLNPNMIHPGQQIDISVAAEKANLLQPYIDSVNQAKSQVADLYAQLKQTTTPVVAKASQTATHAYNTAQIYLSGAVAAVGAGIVTTSEYLRGKKRDPSVQNTKISSFFERLRDGAKNKGSYIGKKLKESVAYFI